MSGSDSIEGMTEQAGAHAECSSGHEITDAQLQAGCDRCIRRGDRIWLCGFHEGYQYGVEMAIAHMEDPTRSILP